MSIRKPHNDHAGYVAMLTNRVPGIGGYVTIYRAYEAGIDDRDGKYAVVCSAHATIVNTTSIPLARPFMKWPEFCEACMEVAAAEYPEGEGGT